MNPQRTDIDRPLPNSPDVSLYLDRYEQAWEQGPVPDLRQYYSAASGLDDGQRRELLSELVAIDLELRWRRTAEMPIHSAADFPEAPQGDPALRATLAAMVESWRLEDYVSRCPDLGPLQDVPLKLICDEYRVRQRWGDRPSHEGFLKRFPGRSSELIAALADIDDHLRRELDLCERHGLRDACTSSNTKANVGFGAPSEFIGPYKILQPIAQGGMGSVFLAEQQEPVRRRVALKIIKSEIPSKDVLARFEAERQALAMMDHQNIARVLDAGVTADGLPYFAMELVKGVPITAYCDQNKLTPKERLELFVQVCRAIQHAHQKGIIHRDIKPSNVLVTLYDSKPVAKVIDFGLAKALQSQMQLTERTMFTQFGQVVGTLEYMSPEQAEMNTLDVDTRTDVYSLGVMLYELLTGSTPIGRERLKSQAFDRILQLIREEEAPRPSARLSDSGDAITGISEQRRTNPQRLSLLLRRELDWIALKALEKDRTRRYDGAAALADDVERYLGDEPIKARPPSLGYRIGKAARKHKAVFSTVVLAFVLLLAGLAGTGTMWWRAFRAEQAALAEAKNARLAQQSAEEATTLAQLSAERAEQAKQDAERAQKSAERAKADAERAKEEVERAKEDAERSKTAAVESLVTALMYAPPNRVPQSIAALRPHREIALPILRNQFAAVSDLPKLQLGLGLVAMREAPHDYLAEQASTANGVTATWLLAAFRSEPEAYRNRLARQFETLEPQERARERAKLATILMDLGQVNPARVMLRNEPNPVERTAFIEEVSNRRHAWAGLQGLLASEEDTDFRSGMCLAWHGLDESEREPLNDLVRKWYSDVKPSGVRAAAESTLRAWRVELPKREAVTAASSKKKWSADELGITLVQIPAGSFDRVCDERAKLADVKGPQLLRDGQTQKVTVSRAFFLADREITLRQFRAFTQGAKLLSKTENDQAETDPRKGSFSPRSLRLPSQANNRSESQIGGSKVGSRRPVDDELPVQNIPWELAAQFCNWLSEREEREPVYRQMDNWNVVPGANGYRLPTEAEWELACRAGTKTMYCCGDDLKALSQYAVVRTRLAPVATKCPNAWGLFDMHGNVAEWCQDWYGSYDSASDSATPVDKTGGSSSPPPPVSDPLGPTKGRFRVVRGGNFREEAGSGTRSFRLPDERSAEVGFRVARNAD